MKVLIKKVNPLAAIPKYATPGAAGFDLASVENVVLKPGETRAVKTGLVVEIPPGFEMQIRPRSGLSLKTTLRVANAPGTVDSDYRGEVAVILTNTSVDARDTFGNGNSGENQTIFAGDRIAQGVIVPVVQATFEEVVELSETERGAGGFGSTGK